MAKADIKRISARVLFSGELILFVWIYLYGAHGFVELTALREECARIVEQKNEHAAAVKKLQEKIIAWNVHSFAKEQFAREQLQMARNDEIIYLT